MTNPYAPPQAAVRDIVDPSLRLVPAERATRLGAAILDSFIFMLMVYTPLFFGGMFIAMNGLPTDPSSGDAPVQMVNYAMGIAGIFALIGFIVWSAITIVFMRRNGQTIAKKATRHQGRAQRRLAGRRSVASSGCATCVNGILGIIPLYGFDRHAVHLRRIAAVPARQDRRHDRRQSLRRS